MKQRHDHHHSNHHNNHHDDHIIITLLERYISTAYFQIDRSIQSVFSISSKQEHMLQCIVLSVTNDDFTLTKRAVFLHHTFDLSLMSVLSPTKSIQIETKPVEAAAMPISGGCICSAKGVYIYREKSVHLSRKSVRLMSFLFIYNKIFIKR